MRPAKKPRKCVMCDGRKDAAKLVAAVDGTIAVYVCSECELRIEKQEYRCHG